MRRWQLAGHFLVGSHAFVTTDLLIGNCAFEVRWQTSFLRPMLPPVLLVGEHAIRAQPWLEGASLRLPSLQLLVKDGTRLHAELNITFFSATFLALNFAAGARRW